MCSVNSQLSYPASFDVSSLVFPEPIASTNPAMPYHRLPLAMKNDDGSIGDVILCTEKLFSFGVKEITDPSTKKGTGKFNIGLAMFNRNGATDEEKKFVEVYQQIVEKCKNYLLELKEDENFQENDYRINEDNLFDFVKNSISLGPRKGKHLIDPVNIKPIINPKLLQKNVTDKETGETTTHVLTKFYNELGEDVSYEDILNKYLNVTAAIKIEGIFINKKTISLQVKLLEAEVDFVEQGAKSLLRNRVKKEPVLSSKIQEQIANESESESESDENDDKINVSSSEDKAPTPEPEPVKKKVVKRIIKKKA